MFGGVLGMIIQNGFLDMVLKAQLLYDYKDVTDLLTQLFTFNVTFSLFHLISVVSVSFWTFFTVLTLRI